MSSNSNTQDDLTIFRNKGRPLPAPEDMGEFAESAGNGKMDEWDDFISGAGDGEALEKNN